MNGGLSSAYPDAQDSPGLLLWQVTNSWQAAQRAAVRRFDLIHVQFVLPPSLTWRQTDTPTTQSELAAHDHTDPMMTSQVLRALEGKGLSARDRHPTDARARALTVTPRGAEVANAANATVETVDRVFFARLGDQQLRFTTMLRTPTNPVNIPFRGGQSLSGAPVAVEDPDGYGFLTPPPDGPAVPGALRQSWPHP